MSQETTIHLLSILVLLLPAIISLVLSRWNKFDGSDHYIHQLYIDLIRQNKHLMIDTCTNFVNENRMAYPQLLHWVVAWFPKSAEQFISKYLQVFVNLLSSAAFYGFIRIYGEFEVIEQIGQYDDLIYKFVPTSGSRMFAACLLFVLIPFSYNTNNAKNTGLSARGLGLLLGQVFLGLLLLYDFEQNFWFLLPAAIVVWIILLSSTFAGQFVVFGSLLLALFTLDPMLLLPLVVGLVLFFAITPKVATTYIKGQLVHKKLYSKYIAQIHILKTRPSIWLDWFTQIPKRLRWFLSNPKENGYHLDYVLNNAIAVFVLQMSVVFIAIFVATNDFFRDAISTSISGLSISVCLLVCFTLFLLTSVRKTRFLGEPERYLEFGIPFAAMLVAKELGSTILPFVLFCFSFAFIIWNILRFINQSKNKTVENPSEAIRLFLEREAGTTPVRLMVPHTQDRRKMRNAAYQQFDFIFFNETNGGYTITEAFDDNYGQMKLELVAPIIQQYNLNYLLTRKENHAEILTLLHTDNIETREIITEGPLILSEITTA